MNRPLVAGAAPAPSDFPDDLLQPSEEESAAYSEQQAAATRRPKSLLFPSRGVAAGPGVA